MRWLNLGTNVNLRVISRSFFAMVLVLTSSVTSFKLKFHSGEYELAEEVVSIYNENFNTPMSREPYFIKVHRCIIPMSTVVESQPCWPAAAEQTEIEIVVPDINNKTKFYKYVVHNHTSCECGKTPAKLHKELPSNEMSINKTVFLAKFPKNPVNLRNCQTLCDKPQPRYWINEVDGILLYFKYILFHECLPGCNRKTSIKNTTVEYLHSGKYDKSLSNDEKCWPYKANEVIPKSPRNLINASKRVTTSHLPACKTKPLRETETGNGFLIYIGSAKIFLAALVLTLILLSILIVDFNLCHRKKGMLYSLLKCKKAMDDNTSKKYVMGRQDVIEMV